LPEALQRQRDKYAADHEQRKKLRSDDHEAGKSTTGAFMASSCPSRDNEHSQNADARHRSVR